MSTHMSCNHAPVPGADVVDPGHDQKGKPIPRGPCFNCRLAAAAQDELRRDESCKACLEGGWFNGPRKPCKEHAPASSPATSPA